MILSKEVVDFFHYHSIEGINFVLNQSCTKM